MLSMNCRGMVSLTIIKLVWFMCNYVIQNYDMPTFLRAQLSFLFPFFRFLTTKTFFSFLGKKTERNEETFILSFVSNFVTMLKDFYLKPSTSLEDKTLSSQHTNLRLSRCSICLAKNAFNSCILIITVPYVCIYTYLYNTYVH